MDLFEAGEIVKTRGLHGCMKVLSYLKSESDFSKPDFVYIGKTSGQKNRFCLKKIDKTGSAFFIEVEEIKDVESAKAFVGCKVYLPKDVLKKLPSGEYYVHDIIGLDVYNEEPPLNTALIMHNNVVCTPHLGASTFEAQENVGLEVAEQIVLALKKSEVKNCVNGLSKLRD